ncbi:hypothetical protein QRX60_42810 [Amycolatopsis mongoliensis]|uniref:Uncharacterized protein n=1 Tax=Amycolatopsis mongoliensis TaxID=715475 RepID=A0A9Y2NCI8_9PSEU|nr:hypothetical protein [Amycolatopsis sp. 4-36]WIY00721.1 hypothetical protein QRX60_42810 [Amycolatopsis sp. 4-36]
MPALGRAAGRGPAAVPGPAGPGDAAAAEQRELFEHQADRLDAEIERSRPVEETVAGTARSLLAARTGQRPGWAG